MISEKKLIPSETLFPMIEELLAKNMQAVFYVTGMSMWPLICHGRDSVTVEGLAAGKDRVHTGDIVLLRTPDGRYLLHRITALRRRRLSDGKWHLQFQTTGDGNCFRDGWFAPSCLRARVTAVIRKGHRIDCQNRFWKSVFRIWMMLYPVRPFLLRLMCTAAAWHNRNRTHR